MFTLVVGAVIGFVVVENGLVPANADAQPPGLERWAAQTSLRATLRRAAAAAPSPPAVTTPDLLAAVKLYAENCIICHGTAKQVMTNIGVGVYQNPPRFGRPKPSTKATSRAASTGKSRTGSAIRPCRRSATSSPTSRSGS